MRMSLEVLCYSTEINTENGWMEFEIVNDLIYYVIYLPTPFSLRSYFTSKVRSDRIFIMKELSRSESIPVDLNKWSYSATLHNGLDNNIRRVLGK